MNENCLEGKACPKCGYQDEVLIVAKIQTSLRDDGADHYADSIKDGDVEYNENSPTACPECGFEGIFEDFDKGKRRRCSACGQHMLPSQLREHIEKEHGVKTPVLQDECMKLCMPVDVTIRRCKVCQELVIDQDLRVHLVGHNAHAEGFETADVLNQFEEVSDEED